MPRTRSQGWSVTVTHPQTDRTIRPDVLDEPQFTPSLNSLPEVRVPVRRAPEWLSAEFDDDPTMSVYLDGEELPIDQLRDVTDQQDRTILVGEGGIELKNRVQAEYRSEQRPDAVRDLISTETTYATDVDDTDTPTDEDVTVQDVSGESELSGVLTPAADEPLVFTGGGVMPAQTSFTTDSSNFTINNTNFLQDGSYSDGEAEEIESSTAYIEVDFTTSYTIPESAVSVYVRFVTQGGGSGPGLELTLNGHTWQPVSDGAGFGSLEWRDFANNTFGVGTAEYTGGDLPAGSHTLRIQGTTSGDGQIIDVATGVLDNRFSYTFDNTLNTSGGYLDGPELYPQAKDAVFNPHTTAFSIVAGEATATLTDTSNNQALALSNDFGSTYPLSASNSATVSGSFPDPGAALNLKATLSRYSPSGAQSATPRFGYDAQRLDGYELTADIRFEALLIDDKFDNNLESVLNDIAGEQYIWSYQIQNGTPTLAWTEREQRVGEDDPDLEDAQITKQGETWDSVTIKGSNLSVSGEPFTASQTFQDLVQDDLLTGSDAVRDPDTGTQFDRGTDYEMDYSNGEIRALSGGDLTLSDTYEISYEYEVKGTHVVNSPPDKELVRTVSGVVSDRQAEQIAFVVAEIEPQLDTPRYEGQLIVPRVDATFDPLEALPLADLDLPDAATPLSIGGQPEVTPRGLVFNVGSAPKLEAQLSGITNRLGKVADRV